MVAFEKPREIAARVLRQREQGLDYVEDLLETGLARSSISTTDRGLVMELVFGVVRWQSTLDWLIARKTAGRVQKPGLQILLRLGLYQVFWLSRIPDHAAVNETVDMARRQGFGPQAGFVNAVLRGFLRERDQTRAALDELKQTDVPVGYSHPRWLCERWEHRLGREQLVRLLEWNNSPPKTFARVNLLRADPDALREQWAREKVDAQLAPTDWTGSQVFELRSFPPLGLLPSFTAGYFYIQDPSTLLAVAELDPQPGETIIDACAAPGGKTAFIAERMRNQGVVLAQDQNPARLELVKENCARLGVTCVQFSPLPAGLPVDRILVDAPCSNTGVMRRRVDLRWRIRETELVRLRDTQRQLLLATVPKLKPGGILVYSTCSLEPEENAGLVKNFLAEAPMMQLQRECSVTPWEHGVDGAYVARFVKAAS